MKGKKIVITGASRGIGHEMALDLAAQGHQVLAISRNKAALEDLKSKNQQISILSIDIAMDKALMPVVNFVEMNWKQVDVLIHNAGKLINKPFLETTSHDYEAVFKVNVFAVAELTKSLFPFLINGSHVLTISSMGGIQGSLKFPGLAAYSASKGALITLTELMAEEFKDSGISFNSLALGAVQTEMLAQAFPDFKAPLSADEMASYIINFALTGAKFFNGKVLQVSSSTP